MRLDLTNATSIPQTQNYFKIPAYFVGFFAIWKLIGLLLHRYLVRKKTVVYDIPNLAIPRPESKRLDGTAGHIQRTFLLTVMHNPCANQVCAVDTFKKLFYENLDWHGGLRVQ